MRDYLTREGYDIIELSETDSAFLEGLSRSKLQQALELASSGKIQVFMFFSPDRFTRDIGDGVILRRDLRRYNVRLFCVYPTPREITSDMETEIVIDEPYALVVKEIYEWYYTGTGAAEIAHTLNKLGVATPGALYGRPGEEWTAHMVRKVLRNESYTGTWYAYTWKKVGKKKIIKRDKKEQVAIQIPVIIPRNRWEQIKAILRSRSSGKVRSMDFLMRTRITCQCGKSMRSNTKDNGITPKIYAYYRCVNPKCSINELRAGDIDRTVWETALELAMNPAKLLQGYQELQREQSQQVTLLQTQIRAINEQIAQQEEALNDLIDQRTKAKSPTLKALLDDRAEAVGNTLAELRARKEALEALEPEVLTDEDIVHLIDDVEALREMEAALREIDETADFAAQLKLIQLFNLRCTLRVEQGDLWVDTLWLRQKQSRKVCAGTSRTGKV